MLVDFDRKVLDQEEYEDLEYHIREIVEHEKGNKYKIEKILELFCIEQIKPPKEKYKKISKRIKLQHRDDFYETCEEIAEAWGCPNINSNKFAQADETKKYELYHFTKKECGYLGLGEGPVLCCRRSCNSLYVYIEEHGFGDCTRWDKED